MLFQALDVVKDDYLSKVEFLEINKCLPSQSSMHILAKMKIKKPSNKIETAFETRSGNSQRVKILPQSEEIVGSSTQLITKSLRADFDESEQFNISQSQEKDIDEERLAKARAEEAAAIEAYQEAQQQTGAAK